MHPDRDLGADEKVRRAISLRVNPYFGESAERTNDAVISGRARLAAMITRSGGGSKGEKGA